MYKNQKPATNSAQKQVETQKRKVKKPTPLVIGKSNKYVLGGYFSLGLNNFYKAILNIFIKTGIKTISKKGTVLYPEEKIGAVLHTLYRSLSGAEHSFNDEERAWAGNFKLDSGQQVRLQKLLFHHFPVLGPIMADEAAYKASKTKKSGVTDTYTMTRGVTLPECLAVLSTVAQGLVDCRNTGTHYEPYNSREELDVQYAVQKDIVRYLDKALVASRRLDKERNRIDTAMMEFLTGASKNLQQYINRYGFYPKYDETISYDAAGKEKKKMVERDDFFYKIGGKTKTKDAEYTTLSGFGLCYFCAIFLSKSQARQMLSDIGLFEKSPYPAELNDIIRDMMSIYRIRAPRGKKKLEGSDGKATLALDILNELRKCPRELFDVLTKEGQSYFEDEINLSAGLEADGENGSSEVVKRFRSVDRFPHLAMRYIDETETFENIRFQVQLGKYRFKFYDKQCIDGGEYVRSLQKEINGFGRLQEIERERKEKYKDILQQARTQAVKVEGGDLELDLLQFEEDSKESIPYITDSRAFYNIHNNRIGLFWNEKFVNGRCIPKKGDYIPSLGTNDQQKAVVEMPAPMAMLSVYELPAMLFYQYLLSRTKADKTVSAERAIIDKYNSLRQFFTEVGNGDFGPVGKLKELAAELERRYNLRPNEIPEKLVEYLSGKKTADPEQRRRNLMEDRLKLRLQRAVRRRDRYKDDRKKIGDKENKYAKKAYTDVRHGALARYLSESLIEWQPTEKNGQDKLTGLNFSVLQAELATFNSPEKYGLIKQMLQSARLLDGAIAHPFLSKLMKHGIRNVEEFYLFYLNEEINYLKTLFEITYKGKRREDATIDFDKTRLKDGAEAVNIPFIRGKARWEKRTQDYCRDLAKRYLEVDGKRTAVWLPDGLFAQPILELLKNNYSDHAKLMERLGDEALNNNVAYLISSYFETVLDDRSQPFYYSYKEKDSQTGRVHDFRRVYDLFNILNNEKVRNALVPVPMTSDRIRERFAEKAVGWDGNPVMVYGANRKPMRDAQGKPIYKKQIQNEIDDYVCKMTKQDKGNHETLEEAKEAMKRRLTRCVSEVKANERTIRRYKTQDMILFLMAQRLMEESVRMEKIRELREFRLAAVCNGKFLNQKVDFEFPVDVSGKTVYISQENMALKNYGEFYQLLSDDRLPSLLEKLAQVLGDEQIPNVDYNQLMGELTSYDIHRSRIFYAVHQLEKQVVSNTEFRNFLNNPSDKRFFIDNDTSKMAKRNNFRSLLQLLEEKGKLTEEECQLIISIRNAFSHNHYKISFDKVAADKELAKATLVHASLGKEVQAKLTTLATLVVNKLKKMQEEVQQGKTEKV